MFTIQADNSSCSPQPRGTASHTYMICLAIHLPVIPLIAIINYYLSPSPHLFTRMPKKIAYKIENHRFWTVTNTDESRLQVLWTNNTSLKASFSSSEKRTSILQVHCNRYIKHVKPLDDGMQADDRCKFMTISEPDYELQRCHYLISSP